MLKKLNGDIWKVYLKKKTNLQVQTTLFEIGWMPN